MVDRASERPRPPIKKGTTPLNPDLMKRAEIKVNAKLPEKKVKIEDNSDVAKIATEGLKGDSRRGLLMIKDLIRTKLRLEKGTTRQGLDLTEKLIISMNSQLEVFLKSQDPKDKILGIRFMTLLKESHLSQLNKTIFAYESEITKSGISENEKNQYNAVINELKIKRDGIVDEKTKEIKQKGLIHEIDDLKVQKDILPKDIPDPFYELAEVLDIPIEEANTNVLDSMEHIIRTKSSNKKAEKMIVGHLKEKGLAEDSIKVIQEMMAMVRGEATKVKVEKATKFVGKGALAASAVAALFLWLGMKSNEQKQGAF